MSSMMAVWGWRGDGMGGSEMSAMMRACVGLVWPARIALQGFVRSLLCPWLFHPFSYSSRPAGVFG